MPQVDGLSLWERHKAAWKGCTRCLLSDCRGKRGYVVLARGRLPCDVLLIGESPGPSENAVGLPFVGPAGHLLDEIISQAGFNVVDYDQAGVRYAFTNLVACIPLDDSKDKFAEPPKEAIEACAPRLRELVRMAKPKLIVCVGALSDKWAKKIIEEDYGRTDKPRAGGKDGGATKAKGTGNRNKPVGSGGDSNKVTMERNPGGIRYVSITHPAAILRAGQESRSLMAKRCVVVLSDALAELFCEGLVDG